MNKDTPTSMEICGEESSDEEEELLVFVDMEDLNGIDFEQYLATAGAASSSTSSQQHPPTTQPPTPQNLADSTTPTVPDVPSSSSATSFSRIPLDELKVVLKDVDDCTGEKTPQVNFGKFKMRGQHELNLGTMLFFEVNHANTNGTGSSNQQEAAVAAEDAPIEEPTTPSASRVKDIKFVGHSINKLKCELIGFEFDAEKMKQLEEEQITKVKKTVKKAKDAMSSAKKKKPNSEVEETSLPAEEAVVPMDVETAEPE